MPVATPVFNTVALATVPEVQAALLVMMAFELSEYVAVATNCCWVPTAMLAVAGVTAMLTRVRAGTVTVVLAVWPLKLAFMTLLPKATPVTRPLLATVAAAGVTDTKLLPAVTSAVLLSE